jgi:hypothetical protein
MKKFSVIALAILMAVGMSTAAHAAYFDIDFYGGTTGLVQGVYDTGATIDLEPGTGWVMASLYISGLDELSLYGMAFDLAFDDSNMMISDLDLGDAWGFVFTQAVTDGHVLVEAGTVTPQTGDDILLATFMITCTATSFDELWLMDFDDVQPGFSGLDPSGNPFDLDQELFPAYLASINQVPIPSAVWLFGSGLLGLVGLRRRIGRS